MAARMGDMMGNIRQKLAAAIYPEAVIERRRLESYAYEDALTGLGNRRAYDIAVQREPALAVIIFDLNNIGLVNKQIGHKQGDECIVWASEVILSVTSAFIGPRFCFRTGGDEFVVLAPYSAVDTIIKNVESIHGAVYFDGVVVSIAGSAGQTFEEADQKLQEHKQEIKQLYYKAA